MIRALLCAAAALGTTSCQVARDPRCPTNAEAAVQLYGAVSARGRVRFGEPGLSTSPDALPLRVALDFEEPNPDIVLVGVATCEAGVIRARLATRTASKPVILGAAIEAIYRPTLVPGELVGGFSAQLENLEGPGVVDLVGFIGDAPRPSTAVTH